MSGIEYANNFQAYPSLLPCKKKPKIIMKRCTMIVKKTCFFNPI